MNPRIVKAYAAKMSASLGRRVPAREAEAEMLRVAREVAAPMGARFAYGYHEPADIVQEAVLEALEVLGGDTYDPTRPLANFLSVHVANRIRNKFRRECYRAELPCSCCDPQSPPAEPCKKFLGWRATNASKQNLMRPLDVATVGDDGGRDEPDAAEAAAEAELVARIEGAIPGELRADFLRMRGGVPVPKGRRQKVREAVLAALGQGAGGADE